MRFSLLLGCVVSLSLACGPAVASAHDASEEGSSEKGSPGNGGVAVLADGYADLTLPVIDCPKPWSDKPLLDDPERFQIAIMTDRTGGHRPGVWMDAVRKLNILRPQFVMSVGDLIEGYTEDRDQVDREWDEFLGFIDQMQMKFFFVAGNHDLSNPMMHEKWRERFGPKWYSFDYKGVHFVCLCSEDPVNRIGDKQVEWLAKDLAEHRDARWTLVFLHKPLWTYAERDLERGEEDSTNFKRVEALLSDRPHTVFAGHVHHYVQYERNGQQYIHLATTGGGSRQRGVPYGEFDHVMWLTMEADGPHLAILKLDGVLAPDTINEAGIARFRRFLDEVRITAEPILLDDQRGFEGGTIQFQLENNFDQPVEITGKISGLPMTGITVDSTDISLNAEAGDKAKQSVRVGFRDSVGFADLQSGRVIASIKSIGDGALTAERTVPIVIDERFTISEADSEPEIDGDLRDWGELELASAEEPLLTGNPEEWNGPGDASVRFSTAYDSEWVYVAAEVTDDQVVEGDKVMAYIDGRPIDDRRRDPDYQWNGAAVGGGPSEAEPFEMKWLRRGRRVRQAKGAIVKSDEGYRAEMAVPVWALTRERENWGSHQLTIVVHDVDASSDEGCSVVWRGTPRYGEDSTGFGHFLREPQTQAQR
ncbi:MAG: metallophosphoesterase [Planctomycetota bacterium]